MAVNFRPFQLSGRSRRTMHVMIVILLFRGLSCQLVLFLFILVFFWLNTLNLPLLETFLGYTLASTSLWLATPFYLLSGDIIRPDTFLYSTFNPISDWQHWIPKQVKCPWAAPVTTKLFAAIRLSQWLAVFKIHVFKILFKIQQSILYLYFKYIFGEYFREYFKYIWSI